MTCRVNAGDRRSGEGFYAVERASGLIVQYPFLPSLVALMTTVITIPKVATSESRGNMSDSQA